MTSDIFPIVLAVTVRVSPVSDLVLRAGIVTALGQVALVAPLKDALLIVLAPNLVVGAVFHRAPAVVRTHNVPDIVRAVTVVVTFLGEVGVRAGVGAGGNVACKRRYIPKRANACLIRLAPYCSGSAGHDETSAEIVALYELLVVGAVLVMEQIPLEVLVGARIVARRRIAPVHARLVALTPNRSGGAILNEAPAEPIALHELLVGGAVFVIEQSVPDGLVGTRIFAWGGIAAPRARSRARAPYRALAALSD